jgi:uncharacterized membrane protein
MKHHALCIIVVSASLSFAGASTWYMYQELMARTLVGTSAHYISTSLKSPFSLTGTVLAVSPGKALIIEAPSRAFNDTMRVLIAITPDNVITRARAVPADTVTHYIVESTPITNLLVGAQVVAEASINEDGTLQLTKLQLEE